MNLLRMNQVAYTNQYLWTPDDTLDIASAFGKPKAVSNGFMCCCPAHDDKNPSLSISLGIDGQLLLHCFAGCKFEDILQAMKTLGLLSNNKSHIGNVKSIRIALSTQEKNLQQDSNLKYAKELWNHAVSPANTLAETYLKSRAIQGDIPATIRFMPKAKYAENVFYPCLIAAITCHSDNEIIGIHRTYLASDGKDKASVNPNKKMLGCVKGGAVRLSEPGSKLAISEGVETGLSFQLATGLPTWAALSARGMENVIVPPLDITQEIIIAADADKAGIEAANKLAIRLLNDGYKVSIVTPHEGMDFNDVLRG